MFASARSSLWSTPRRGLASWIAVSLALAVLMATLVLLGLVERFARDHAARTALGALNQIAWQMRDQLDTGMSYRYEELQILAGLDELQPGRDPRLVRPVLQRVRTSFPRYAWLGYASADGTVLAANDGLLEGQKVAARPWFKGALQGPFVGDVHDAVLLAKLLPRQAEPWRFVDLAVPIRNTEGAVTHVLGAHLSWGWARDLQRDLLAPASSTYQAQVFVVGRQGVVLLGPPGTEGKPLGLPASTPSDHADRAGAMRTWSDGESYATAQVATRGHGRYPGLGWSVVVRQPESVAFAEYRRLREELIVGGLLTCLLAALCSSWVARRLTRPLTELTRAIQVRSHADETGIARRDDYLEVALLSGALADLTERERRHLDELRRIHAGLEQRIADRTREISEREAEARQSRERLRAIADNLPALVAEVDLDLRYRFANMTYQDWFDVAPAELIGQRLQDLYGDEAVASWKPQLDRVLSGERVQFERSMVVRGQPQFSSVTYLPQRDAHGRVDGFYVLVFDITASKQLELRLQNEARHDALTGLPNRRHLLHQLPQAIARADRQGLPLALLFLDLDGFKAVNDTHGHEAGDELLQQVAARLQSVVRKGDTVARLAGDEFVVLLEPLSQGSVDAASAVDKIERAVRVPFRLSRAEIGVGVSVGVGLYEPGSERTAEQLLAGADAAMYQAKKGSRRSA